MYGILIYDGVEPIDLGATFGVLSMAKRIAPDLRWTGIAKRKGPVEAANGLIVHADHGFEDCPPLTDLVVTGGPGWSQAAKDPQTLAFIRASPARPSAICTGALILDAAGTLEARHATTKTEVFDGEVPPLQLLSRQVTASDHAIVTDQDVLTSGGVTLGIDAMLHLLARSHGEHVAAETARVMEYTRAREANRAAKGYKLGAA
ncbi:MAG: DJ-1/PfpI family protein [Pseudomonadota bacterium]